MRKQSKDEKPTVSKQEELARSQARKRLLEKSQGDTAPRNGEGDNLSESQGKAV